MNFLNLNFSKYLLKSSGGGGCENHSTRGGGGNRAGWGHHRYGGHNTHPGYSAAGPNLVEAACNAFYECGGAEYETKGCFIPADFCKQK